MSSQFSNGIAVSNNISLLTAHLKNGKQLNNQLIPPPLLKSSLLNNKDSNLLNLSQQLIQRANRLSTKQWDNLNYDTHSPLNASYLMNSNYLNQLLNQRKTNLESTLKLIDYNQQLNLSNQLNSLNGQLLNQQNGQLGDQLNKSHSSSSSRSCSEDEEQDLVLDLSKSNKSTIKSKKQNNNQVLSSNKLSNSLSTTASKFIKLSDEIKRPSSLPQPKSIQLKNKSQQNTIGKKRSSQSSTSAKKAALRKIPFDDEFKSSPVSGTFILTDNDVALSEWKNGDIDPNHNRVQITAETRADLEKIENHIGDYVCRLCKLCFEDAFGLAQHRCSRIVHIEYKCPECEKEFSCPANLASHRRWHTFKLNQPNQLNQPNAKPQQSSNNTKITNQVNSPSSKVTKLAMETSKKISNLDKHLQNNLSNSNNSSKLSSLLNGSNTPSSPKLDNHKEPTIIQQKINIKVNDQIVSVSVSKDDQQFSCNNKVKVTKTAIIPEASAEDKELIESKDRNSSTAVKKESNNGTVNDKDEIVDEKIIEQMTTLSSTTNQSQATNDDQQVSNDNYCPKKFRRQQYLNKSPRSENQENEMMNFNITDDSNQLNEQQDCQSLNNSCNSTSAKSLKDSSLAITLLANTAASLANNATPRKKRARSSVTDEQNNHLKIEENEPIDEQVFSDQNTNDSSISFESQKKFLILKKLKSEQN